MIRCLLIDDEQPALNVLQRYVERTPGLELLGTYTSPKAGVEQIRQKMPDLVFLDIQMDELSGTEVARTMETTSRIIFTTAFTEFGAESYEFAAVDYLVKPYSFNRFRIAIDKVRIGLQQDAASLDQRGEDQFIFLKTGTRGSRIKVQLNEIEYIEASNNYVAFYGFKGRVLAYMSLKEISFSLPPGEFMRVHRSFIVGLKHIQRVDNNELTMKRTKKQIPIGDLYKEPFRHWMQANMVERSNEHPAPD